jgi:bifunctional enzyme CysN/CysC
MGTCKIMKTSSDNKTMNDRRLNLVVVGHVDHGKSTVVGRLLADTGSFSKEKLDEIRLVCEQQSKRFEYAFLLDALQDERSQGITIDAARMYFNSKKREYVIIDAPGHIEFLKNMITGASYADAAVLVVDAREGIQENSKRHAYMLSMLGVKSLIVLINKMDLVEYREERFNEIRSTLESFLSGLSLTPDHCIPVSGIEGVGIVQKSDLLPWWHGPTLLDALDALEVPFRHAPLPFRMYVQDVYRFTESNDTRRIIAGSILSGVLTSDSEIIFYPSGKKSSIHRLESSGTIEHTSQSAGEATGFTLTQQLYVHRGELVCRTDEPPPCIAKRIRVSLFWLGEVALREGEIYTIRIGTMKVKATIESLVKVVDASSLEKWDGEKEVTKNMVADAILNLDQAIAFDVSTDTLLTNRFVIFADYRISGGGIIRESLTDPQTTTRISAIERNKKWQYTNISTNERAARFKQNPTLILITGEPDTGRTSLARTLERELFEKGRLVYYLGIGNMLYGLGADLGREQVNSDEHIRRLSEVANILLDTGLILIVTASEIGKEQTEKIKVLTADYDFVKVWIGTSEDDSSIDLNIKPDHDMDTTVKKICGLMF